MKAEELKIDAAWRGGTPTSIGQKLKSTTTDWPSHVNVGTNVVGFKALPAVTMGAGGTFSNANQRAAYWTPSKSVNLDKAYVRIIDYNKLDILGKELNKGSGLSVRLVK